MPKISKRAFWGYASASVDAAVRSLQEQHEAEVLRLQTELAEIEQTNEQLRKSIERLQGEVQEDSEFEQRIAALLLQAHVDQTKAVQEMIDELKQVEATHEEVQEISKLHSEAVVHQVLEKLRSLETVIQQQAKEGERGGPFGL